MTEHSPAGPSAPFVTTTRTLRFGTGPEWSSHQLALTAANTLGVSLYLAALHGAAGGFPGVCWLLLLVPATTMSFAGSGLSLGLMGLLLYGWFILMPAGSFTWWSLPAAAGLLLSHSAVSLSATAPPSARFSRDHLRRRTRGHLVALSAAVVMAAGAALLSGRGLGPSPVAYAVGLAGVAVGIWLART
ncbi:MAG: hypothetical protein L0H96_18845, partial [Humibacillus sp.]|nr:hypothetical protein [Humibacillus sp.]